jgi:hypothetical protein
MTEKEIKDLFYEEINKRETKKKLGVTRHQMYRYRHHPDVSVMAMLEVLWRLDKLEFKLE